jgi:hypothetical protein
MAGAAAASTAAEWADPTAVWAGFTAVAAGFTAADLADFTVTSRVCTMVSASGTTVFGAGFSSAA